MEQNTLWVNKEPSLAHKINEQKGTVVILLAAVLVSYILAVFLDKFWTASAVGIVAPLLFLAVGILHVNRLSADFQFLTVTQKWVYTLILSATIFLLFEIASLWRIDFPFVTMLAGTVAFLLPFVFTELMRTYLQLTFGNASTWQVTNEASLTYPDVYLAGMPLRFKVQRDEHERSFFRAEFRTLAEMNLGQVFYDMVQKQNKKGSEVIALFNDENQPYHWLFFSKNFLGWTRLLDPKLSLAENDLTKASVVHALRLSAGNADLLHELQEKKELNFML